MAELIFRLGQVPDDEAEEVRALLRSHDIPFYETSSGAFGLSLAGIWLPDASQKEEALALLAKYGRERASAQRQDYEARRARGEAETFWQRCRRQPLRTLLGLIAVAVIAYVSIVPFITGL